MQMTQDQLEGGVIRVTLDGRLDREGAEAIEPGLTDVATTAGAWVVVDLSRVTFIASIGMRTLITTAKAQAGRGGRIVLLAPPANVRETLTTAGIDTIIPMYDDLETATASFGRSGD